MNVDRIRLVETQMLRKHNEVKRASCATMDNQIGEVIRLLRTIPLAKDPHEVLRRIRRLPCHMDVDYYVDVVRQVVDDVDDDEIKIPGQLL
jgi:hypothetical protein